MADLRAPHRSVLDIREERSAGNLPFTAIAGRDLGQVLTPQRKTNNMTTLTMNLTSIDTLAFSKRMQKAGLAQHTADELAEALKETQSQSIEKFATKVDLDSKIDHSESKLEQKIELVRKDLDIVRKEVELSKQEVIIKLGRIMYLGIAFLATLIGLAVAFLKF